MGLLDLISTKLDNKLMETKIKKNQLKNLQGLLEMMDQATAPKPTDTNVNVADPTIGNQTGVFNVNQDLGNMPTTRTLPGTMTGNTLLDQILKTYPEHAAAIMTKANDPETLIKRRVLESIGGGTGTPGQPTGGLDLQSIIRDLSGTDPAKATAAASQGAMLEMGGVPVMKATERVQTGQTRALAEKKYNDEIKAGIVETYKDPTGAEYTRYVNKVTKDPITGPGTDPAGWRKSAAAKLEAVDVLIPGRGKVRAWVTPGQEGGIPLGPEPLKEVTEELPGGGQRRRTIPESQPFDITTKQPAGNVAIQGDELNLWVHPATLATATQGMTPDQAKAGGFQRVSTAAKQSIDSLKAATVVVTEIKGLMDKVFPEKESFASPQRILRPIGAALQTNPDATRLFSLVNGTLAPIVRSLGEKGNLSDTDVKRAGKLVISGTDSTKVARDKTQGLLDLLGKIQRSTFSGSGTAPGQKDLKALSNDELLKELEK